MKKVIIPLLFIAALESGFAPALYSQVQSPEKQVLATLAEGETLVNGNRCFTLTPEKSTYYFVTQKQNNYYIYENGKRSGPFTEIKDDMVKPCNGTLNPLCAKFNPADCIHDDIYNKYVVNGDDNMVIRIKDKTYGPYLAVMQLAVTCNESAFAAMVMREDQSLHLINSGGKDVRIDGLPQWLMLSADGIQALAAVGKNIDPATIDMNNFNIADYTAFKVIDLNGNSTGPYTAEKNAPTDFWFCKTGGPHWYLMSENQILRDGKPYKKEIQGYGSCEMWISPDGQRMALVDFGQGTVKETPELWLISSPLEMITYTLAGKTWIKWISLENGTSVVECKKML